MLHKINIIDVDFSHAESSVHGKKPKKFEYIRDQFVWNGITIFTNDMIYSRCIDQVKSKYKIAWLLEPRSIKPKIYEYIKTVENKYDFIITHDEDLLNTNAKYVFAPVGGCWINDPAVYKKNKLVSMIASEKMMTNGHLLRHEVVKNFQNKIDVFGRGYKPIVNKEEGLSEYQFSICIENSSTKNYFTEKLIDCFATRTIPIYWGCSNISSFFDKNSFFQFDTIENLTYIIENIHKFSIDKESIEKNYEISKKYWITEDWIFENILEKIL